MIRIKSFQFGGGEEEDVLWKEQVDGIILNGHELFGLADGLIDGFHSILQGFEGSVFFCNYFFPVPLIHIDGMNGIADFIPSHRIHIGVKPFSYLKTVTVQRITLPFGKRLHNFPPVIRVMQDVKSDRAFHAVQIIVQTAGGIDKERCTDAQKV